MELIELMSPHVAMPVVGVLIFALVVLAFGFRSPVQPPSFNFEEQEKRNTKKRVKQNKVKGTANGHLITSDPSTDDIPKQVKDVKRASSPKAKLVDPKALINKKEKQEPKPENKRERAEKKRQLAKEELKKEEFVLVKKDGEDDGEWTTIQVTKKGKKQKPAPKKDTSHAEPAGETEMEPEVTPTPVIEAAAAAAPAASPEVEEPVTPQDNKNKKKKKNVGKSKQDEKEEIVNEAIEKPSIEIVKESARPEEMVEAKKKKKKDKKAGAAAAGAGAAAASASDCLPQDAAPASGKADKKETSSNLTPLADPDESTLNKQSPKKKKGKSKGKEDMSAEETKDEKSTAPLSKTVEISVEPVKKQTEKISVEPVKKQVEKKSVEPVKKQTEKISVEPVKKLVDKSKKETIATDIKPEPVVNKVSDPDTKSPTIKQSAGEPGANTAITFDEIGDSWTEAAPKTKKKKARRDN